MACGQGRWPVVDRQYDAEGRTTNGPRSIERRHESPGRDVRMVAEATILGYACACTPHTNHPGTGEPSGPDKRYGDHLDGGNGYANVGAGFEASPSGKGGLGDRPRVGPWREYHLNGWQPPPTTPAVVLDPFSGTGCTMHVAKALGRIGIGVDLSMPYCLIAKDRTLARWRADKVHGRRNRELQGALWDHPTTEAPHSSIEAAYGLLDLGLPIDLLEALPVREGG